MSRTRLVLTGDCSSYERVLDAKTCILMFFLRDKWTSGGFL